MVNLSRGMRAGEAPPAVRFSLFLLLEDIGLGDVHEAQGLAGCPEGQPHLVAGIPGALGIAGTDPEP
jgi:hypothetical protein